MNNFQQEGAIRFPKRAIINPLLNQTFSIGSFFREPVMVDPVK
jgi:hypothetical protein